MSIGDKDLQVPSPPQCSQEPTPFQSSNDDSQSPLNPSTQILSEVHDEIHSITQAELEKRKLKSIVWQHFVKIKVDGKYKVKCNYCKKLPSGEIKNGTRHLHHHLDICIQNKALTKGKGGQKTLFF